MGPNINASASKAVLRDCKRRLIGLRRDCGVEDQEMEQISTGDPFTDLVMQFEGRVKDVNSLLDDEDTSAQGDGKEAPALRAQVDAAIMRLEHDLHTLNDMVYQAEADYARAEVKKKSSKKINKRRAIYEQRKTTLQECQGLVLSAKKLREEFRRGKIKRPPATKASKLRTKQLASAQSILTQGNKQAADIIAREPAFGQEALDMKALDAETKQVLKEIEEEKKKTEKGLQNIVVQLRALRQLIHKIGDEIDIQAQTVDALSGKIEETTSTIQKVSAIQTQLLENSSPCNICIKVFLICLILGLIGYFLWKFGVV